MGWLGGLASRASAWADAPLCVAQPPQLTEYTQSDYASSLLCAADEPFTHHQGPLWTAPISAEEARRALKEAAELTQTAPNDALVKLRLVERAMPRIADRLAVQRAELLMRLNRPLEACEAYRFATNSPEPSVAAEARIGYVSCLLETGDKQAETEFTRLCQRYPALGERSAMQVKLAKARERWRNTAGAVPLYRNIDLYYPETGAAAEAREAMARLREQGVPVTPYTPQEWVERAERLVYKGTVEAGRNAVGDLLAMSALRGVLKGRAHILAARVARMEGRWDAVRQEVTNAINSGIPTREAERWLPRLTVETLEPGQGEEKMLRLLAGRPLSRLKFPQLRAALDLAVNYGIQEVASEALDLMTAMGPRLGPQGLFEAASDAVGVASNESLLRAFEALRDVRGYQLSARYFHARALEGLGRTAEARDEYREVAELDVAWERYYGVWAEARLSGLDQAANGTCERDERGACLPDTGVSRRSVTERASLAGFIQSGLPVRSGVSEIAAVFGAPREPRLRLDQPTLPSSDNQLVLPQVGATNTTGQAPQLGEGPYLPIPVDPSVQRREAIVSRLSALEALHGAAYPWLGRAVDLAQLERYDDAAAEIGEVYLAYRDARGGARMRVGAEAVLSNAMQPRHECSGNLRRDRLALDETSRYSLAEAADLLDEPGIALRLRDMRGEPRPRAYADAVVAAAAKFNLDPNLMFAVMRVESVYYRHIVSHAGAVGLMQIMPHTGMRIARALGLSDFNPRELLDPRRNLEFAAWYLSSLIRRFDGRVPLAVAAYNGGPHNVRLWINARPKTMPLEVFLERIPFRETNHYVRRVLTNYAAYRAQAELAMPNLANSLPRPRPDAIAF